jgi:demethylspheroidene O-methyltransferase
MRRAPAHPSPQPLPPPELSFLDRAIGLKDALLASPRFRRFATVFPLTRPVARRRARALFDLCAGFVYSQVLLACVSLGLFELLRAGPQTAQALAPRLGLSPEAALRLLKAAASLGLVALRSGERYGLGPLGAALVGNPGLTAMVEHHALVYADLQDPVALLRGERPETRLRRYWSYADGDDAGARREAYTALMAASQPLVAGEILDAYPPNRHRHWLDVGGGDGSFIAAAAARAPDLRFTLFDLPGVVERARERLADAGLLDRVTLTSGSFLADPLPTGADAVSLVRVVHDHDDDAALAILRAVRRIVPPGGVLVLAEPMSGAPGAAPIGDAYFGLYLLAMGQGRARSPDELQGLLRAAGFHRTSVRRTRMPLLTGLILARP